MRFAHLAQRLFNVPLAIRPEKAEIIMAVLAERLGISQIVRADGSTLVPMALDWFEDDDDGARSSRATGYDNIGGVARIEIAGTLVQKLGTLQPYSGMTGYDGIRENYFAALTDPDVRAVMLDIDSPGGEVAGCFDLVDAMYAARSTKPVWAVLNENACSAAYALASAADHISVPRTGCAGSIGVLMLHVDWSRALNQSGLTVTFITYGERKSDGYPELPLSDEAKAGFQAQIDDMGDLFVQTVARNRNVPADAIRAMQAATFLGGAAVRANLADEVAAPDAAFRSLFASL
jgi:signal peptide peptidase SppA